MVIFSFVSLSLLMIASFIASLIVDDAYIQSAFLDLVKHLSFVQGGIVGVYMGVESFWPSIRNRSTRSSSQKSNLPRQSPRSPR